MTNQISYHYADSNVLTKENLGAWHAPLSDFYEGYTYDGLNRLIASDRYAGTANDQSWNLDALGNITGVTTNSVLQNRTSNSQNQLTAVGTSTLAYDSNGNLTTDDQGRTLAYDAWSRLIQVNSSSGTLIASMGYDGLGRLIARTNGTTSQVDYFFSGAQAIEERIGVTTSSSGTLSSQTVFSPLYVNAPILRDRDTDANGTLDQRTYLTTDANFNVTGVVSTSGSMLQHQVYSAYGVVSFKNADWSDKSSDSYAQENLYQGMLLNTAIGWYFSGQSNVGRWYSPGLMIWTKPDQGYIDSMALYQFVADNPLNRVDPSGLAATSVGPGPVDGNGQPQGAPKLPDGNEWKQNQPSKPGGRVPWGPKCPIKTPKGSQPKISWDPVGKKPHWDVDWGDGRPRERYDENGNPLTDAEAHGISFAPNYTWVAWFGSFLPDYQESTYNEAGLVVAVVGVAPIALVGAAAAAPVIGGVAIEAGGALITTGAAAGAAQQLAR